MKRTSKLKYINNKILVLIILVVWTVSVGVYAYGGYYNYAPQSPLVGNDRDAHGCIGSAGYTWSEPKQKCVRIWEESIYQNPEQEVAHILANKYGKTVEEVSVNVQKQDETHLAGSVTFGQGGPGEGGMFLAVKTGYVWSVVYDGNGNVDCDKMRQDYNFPNSILKPNFCD